MIRKAIITFIVGIALCGAAPSFAADPSVLFGTWDGLWYVDGVSVHHWNTEDIEQYMYDGSEWDSALPDYLTAMLAGPVSFQVALRQDVGDGSGWGDVLFEDGSLWAGYISELSLGDDNEVFMQIAYPGIEISAAIDGTFDGLNLISGGRYDESVEPPEGVYTFQGDAVLARQGSAAVPEPATMALFAAGLMGAALRKRVA